MRICMMSQPTLTMCATTRCATKPGESLITDTGTPSAASRPCAASRTSGRVTGVVMRVRRLAKPNSGSTATVRVGSRPSSRAVLVASFPKVGVYGGEIGHAFGDDGQRVGDESAPGVVDDEAGRVLAAHRCVAEALGKCRKGVRHPRLRAHAIHHLDDLQHGDWVEEVITRD